MGARVAVFLVAMATLAVGMNWLLALAGEPRALWLFRDVLGIVT